MFDDVLHLILSDVFPTGLTTHARDHDVVFAEPLKFVIDFSCKVEL